MEKLNEVPVMGDLLAKRLMNETSIKVIPDFEELQDIKKRKEEKKWKDIIDETVKLLRDNNIATILNGSPNEIVNEEGMEIKILHVNTATIAGVQSVTEYIFRQKGYGVTTTMVNNNSFSLIIKRIEEE